jgi:prepilin-type N-terminal cleavage/methylation domain-containing protein
MKSRSAGFSLPELLVVVVILGVLGAIGVGVSGAEWRRERVNTAAIELAGWLEAIRRESVRGEGCTVMFVNNAALGGNGIMASATPAAASPAISNNCQPGSALVPFLDANSTYTIARSQSQLTLTARGTVFPVPGINDNPAEIRISLNGGAIGRCVRIDGMLGLVEIGRLDTNCVYGGRI